jgi:hypothetical protein
MRQLNAARPAALVAAAVAALAVLTACGSETGDPGAAGGGQPPASTPTSTTGPSGPGSSGGAGSGTAPAPSGPVTSVPSESNLPSPGKSAPPVAGEPTGPTLQLSGVAERGVEPGCVLLRSGSKSYLLLGSKDTIVTGVPIKVTGKVITGVMSYCQQGTPLRVDSVTRG